MLNKLPISLDEISALKTRCEDLRSRCDSLGTASADIAAQCDNLKAEVTAIQNAVTRQCVGATTESISERFRALVDEWKATRGPHSRLDRLVMNPSYQAIIGLGPPAIPLLLKEMEERPSHWDWALRAITRVDPAPKETWGDLKKIAAAWVRWGKENGYSW